MATYNELRSMFTHDDLRTRTEVAVVIAAEGIFSEDPAIVGHAERLVWAKSVIQSPVESAAAVVLLMLAANKSATVEQISTASDSTIQAKVDSVVDAFVSGT